MAPGDHCDGVCKRHGNGYVVCNPCGPHAPRALLSGADVDVYYRTIAIYVSGDYVDFDLSGNFIEEEVAPGTYLAIGGAGAASVGTSGVATISAPFEGLFDYCVTKAEPVQADVYSCVPAQAIAHAQCQSKNHRLILTRR